MKGQGKMYRIGGPKRTTATIGAKLSDMYVTDWDKDIGGMQHRQRVTEREQMGQKMTPIGRSRLIPKGT